MHQKIHKKLTVRGGVNAYGQSDRKISVFYDFPKKKLCSNFDTVWLTCNTQWSPDKREKQFLLSKILGQTQWLSSPSFLLFLDFKSSIARERAWFHSWNNFTWKTCFSRSWMKISWWMFLIKVTEEAADKQTEANQSWLRWSNKQTVDTFLSK